MHIVAEPAQIGEAAGSSKGQEQMKPVQELQPVDHSAVNSNNPGGIESAVVCYKVPLEEVVSSSQSFRAQSTKRGKCSIHIVVDREKTVEVDKSSQDKDQRKPRQEVEPLENGGVTLKGATGNRFMTSLLERYLVSSRIRSVKKQFLCQCRCRAQGMCPSAGRHRTGRGK